MVPFSKWEGNSLLRTNNNDSPNLDGVESYTACKKRDVSYANT